MFTNSEKEDWTNGYELDILEQHDQLDITLLFTLMSPSYYIIMVKYDHACQIWKKIDCAIQEKWVKLVIIFKWKLIMSRNDKKV